MNIVKCLSFLLAKGITVHDPEEFIKPPPEKYVPNPEEMYPDFRSGVYEVLQEQKKEELEKIGIPVWHLSDRLPFTEGKVSGKDCFIIIHLSN